MSFIKTPTNIIVPKIPHLFGGGIAETGVKVWTGQGDDDGFVAFHSDIGYLMTRITNVGKSFAYNLEISGIEHKPCFSDVNGYIYWHGGKGFFYYSRQFSTWVLCDKFPGYEPIETYEYDEDKNKRVYDGDSFCSGLFPSIGTTGKLTPRGKYKNGKRDGAEYEDLEIKIVFPRWEGNCEFGIYEGKDGAEGKRVLGVPFWRGSNAQEYRRSAERVNDAYGMSYRYGAIYRGSSKKWLIGTEGSDDGWWEGSEPKPNQGATFKFKKNEESNAQGNDIMISWVGYVEGNETQRNLVSEVAICY